MHNNYYFLKQLSHRLSEELSGFTLVSCFSQNKEELILEFNNTSRSFFIKASLLPHFCCLSFPSDYKRARKNSADIFPEVVMKKVLSVRSFENDRSFSIALQDSYELLFKMHGNRSNILLIKDGAVTGLFRNHLRADHDLILANLHRPLDFSQRQFNQVYPQISNYYFTFGKPVWDYWHAQKFDQLPVIDQWYQFDRIRKDLESPTYYVCEKEGTLAFSLIPLAKVIRQFKEPIDAVTWFFYEYSAARAFLNAQAVHLQAVKNQIQRATAYINNSERKLSELQGDHHFRLWGDLIMAHLQDIKTGAHSVDLPDFSTNKPIPIKLKPELTPQKNAEVFYRKARNQGIEINQLTESINRKRKEVDALQSELTKILNARDIKSLRKTESKVVGKKTAPVPYHEFEHQGYRIWVGRNAAANDELTLKYGYKEDLWLHAKDVAGSHVLIKHQAGKSFPKEVIERAAQLAAYHSKRKTETLCPVIVVACKFVRKRKGDPAGAVIVEREKIMMAEPKR